MASRWQALFAFIAIFSATQATAQPGAVIVDSLEWSVADSTVIVCGKVVSSEPIPGNYGYFVLVKFHADETLKGPAQTDLAFAVHLHTPQVNPLPDWTKNGKRILLCLTESQKIEDTNAMFRAHAFAPRSGYLDNSAFELDPHADIQALTTSLAPLSKPDDILKHVKSAIKATAKTGQPQRLGIQTHFDPAILPIAIRRSYFGAAFFNVPIDERLERAAHEWLQSKDVNRRQTGLDLIQPFKSRRNIALVKRMLNDPGVQSIVGPYSSTPRDIRIVRYAAIDLLDAWDIRWAPISKASVATSKEMVHVPAGEFTMGGEAGDDYSIPSRKVTLDEFWIAKTDVTVAQFKAYCKATHYKYDWVKFGHSQKDDHPMVNVTWEEARAFCHWVGGELPTEAQWEKAARGTDARRFPWGNDWDTTKLQCGPNTWSDWRNTAPVGSYPAGASPYGCLDMAGNVFQMCLDVAASPGPARNSKAVRGGDWSSDGPRLTMCSEHSFTQSGYPSSDIGFRVAATHQLKLP